MLTMYRPTPISSMKLGKARVVFAVNVRVAVDVGVVVDVVHVVILVVLVILMIAMMVVAVAVVIRDLTKHDGSGNESIAKQKV